MVRRIFSGIAFALAVLLGVGPNPLWANCDEGCGPAYCFDACNSGPLCCGNFGVLVRGGIAPGLFTDRGTGWLTVPPLTPPVRPTGRAIVFGEAFDLPWTVGAELSWNLSCRIQLFLEYAYLQAKGRRVIPDPTAENLFSNLRANSGYLGVRYYLDPITRLSCRGPFALYVGFKAGLSWQRPITLGATVNNMFIFEPTVFVSQTAVSGGLQIGAEWWFCKCWSLLLQGEFIATQAPRSRGNVPFPVIPGFPSDFTPARVGLLLTFPVTLGLRWTF